LIDIVIPVFNESKNIAPLLDNINEQIKTEKNIIIVYDFDEDNTLPVLNKIKAHYPFKIILEKNIFGSGALNAIVTGFRKSTNEAVLVAMADLSDSLQIVDDMYKKLTVEGYDLVCGSRYIKGGRQFGGPFLKVLFSRIAGLSLNLLTRIPTHDISNSFKMYRKTMLDAIEIESNGGFEVGMEIAVKAYINGYRITELPSQWYDRQEGKSNFKMWKWMPNYLHWYFLCLHRKWFGVIKRNQ
jgi:dolichol-phosphate mannosyltransferase